MDVEIYLDPWNKPHGVVYFSCFADFGLLTFFFEDIFTYIHQEYQPVHLFSAGFFFCLFVCCQGNVGLTELGWKQSLLFNFLEEFEQHWYYFLLNFW